MFGLKSYLHQLKDDITEEFFLDTTFNIIPVKYRPYKFLVLAGLPKTTNKPKIMIFALIKLYNLKNQIPQINLLKR